MFRAEILWDNGGFAKKATKLEFFTHTRGLRKDAATLYTKIHSHPVPTKEFSQDTTGEHSKAINAWWQKVLADFKERMPKEIDYTSVLHLDEGRGQRLFAPHKGRTHDRNLQRSKSAQINPCKTGVVHT